MTTRKMLTAFSANHATATRFGSWMFWLAVFVATLVTAPAANAQAPECTQTITAKVVVFDSPTVFNRLGAQNPNWITYALERDIVDKSNGKICGDPEASCGPGGVMLRPDKRPRPLVIRSVAGACLDVEFTNLLDPDANPNPPTPGGLFNDDQVAGRCAGFHASGTELRTSIDDDGSMVGANDPSGNVETNCAVGEMEDRGGLVAPGQSITYELYTPEEGAYIINNYGALLGSEASSGNTAVGMFGALNVEPPGSRIYRSQVTEEEMRLATAGTTANECLAAPPGADWGVDCNPGGQPIIDYEFLYPNVEPWVSEGKAGLPVLNMLQCTHFDAEGACTNFELVHSDINAIIAGSCGDGTWNCTHGSPDAPYPLERAGFNNPQYPNRLEAFREFTSVYHDEQTNSQVFPRWYNDPVLGFTLAGVKDQFMINYGSGGIGSEIIANRLHTGPMHDCTDCAYEEFFLSSSTVGDPALLVNSPANTGIEQCDPTAIAGPSCWRNPANLSNGPIPGNYALYQEDPSNVHHSYTGDHTKIRNTHAGSFEQHIFHLHNHQWLHNPNDDNANYLDAQEIMPGSGHTYELVNGGTGNRNKTAGDAIFHCHFYPHFAQGMWYHIRIMDVMETGSVLAVSGGTADAPGYHQNDADDDGFPDWALRSGQPAVGARALPDGELPDGVPIPAIVPLPGKAMPQMPAKVQVAAVDRGSHSILGGRSGPDGIPDSSQAFVDRTSVAGKDGKLGTFDDLSPGYPFWLAGNECGPEAGFEAPGAIAANPDPDGNPATPDAVCPNGIVGQRMPTPPLDMLTEAGAPAAGYNPAQAGGWDGGLPRHSLLGYVSGGLSKDTNSRLDFRKVVEMAPPVYFPEIGTDLEMVSMRYQGTTRERPSVANNLADNLTTPADFIQNGAPPVPGGPYNDPCIDDTGAPTMSGKTYSWFDGDGDPATLKTKGGSERAGDNPRTYKIANVQIDAVFNKVGYHYPQERIIALWEDVENTINKIRPPEPLVMRFNTFDCGKLLHSNLTPHEYELDDFQVRTPTDVIGQHIHLPKWDLTTNDGAANGWNYEDGALSPGIVQERVVAINHFNEFAGTIVGPDCTLAAGLAGNTELCPLPGQLAPINLTDFAPGGIPTIDTGDIGSAVAPGTTHLTALPHPFFGAGVAGQDYLGARVVIQRMMIDPIVNVAGVDRGLGLTFSHDHYGPSTFQQIGLYSTILAEPAGSTWVHNESGELLNTRPDGGPTTWQAAILTPAAAPIGSTVGSEDIPEHREFYFEMSDFQHAYEPGVYVGANADGVPVRTNIIQPNPFDATMAEAPALRDTWQQTVNPPLKLKSVPFPDIVTANDLCPGPLKDPVTGDPIPGSHTNVSPFVPRPCVEAINISHSSMWVTNYRNEPVALRVFDPDRMGPDGQNGAQALGDKGDLAFAFQSRTDRELPQLNTSLGDTPYPTPGYCSDGLGDGINCDRRPGDPFTPIMRTYEFDHVKIKVQVGATEEQHQTSFHGLKWLSNGSGFGASPNSGWRNFQSHGISEQFSLQMPIIPDRNQLPGEVDYLYGTDVTRDGIWSGTWGVLRTYISNKQRNDLFVLPNNVQLGDINMVDENNFRGVCPKFEMDANGDIIDPQGPGRNIPVPLRTYEVAAVLANKVLPNDLGVVISPNTPVDANGDGIVDGGDSDGDGKGDNVGGALNTAGGTLVYNRRGTVVPDLPTAEGLIPGGAGPLNDPTGMMYVRLEDLEPRWIEGVSQDVNGDTYDDRCIDPVSGKSYINTPECPTQLKAGAPVEPLVLRANAGDCIEVTLYNKFLDQATALSQPVFSNEGGTLRAVFDQADAEKLLLRGATFQTAGGDPVTIDQIVYDRIPDLAGWQDTFWVLNRHMFDGAGAIVPPENRRCDPVTKVCEMHFFNNNLIAPSPTAGIHAQLVEYDSSRDDGVVVGQNHQGTVARERANVKYRYYAGHIDTLFVGNSGNRNNPRRDFRRIVTPVEFGGFNLLSTDRIKQPQKGLYGAMVIEPRGSTWPDALADLDDVADGQGSGAATRKTRAQVSVDASATGVIGYGDTYRENISVTFRIANLRWADGGAIANINQGELGREGAEDSGHAGYNYGTEPSWFRFGLHPDVPFGNAGTPGSYGAIPNVHAFYANGLTIETGNNHVPFIPGIAAEGDPATPVYRATPGQPARIHVLNGASADRDATFILHGHLWQRDPFVCPTGEGGAHYLGLPGMCWPGQVASQALGLNPIGKYQGGEEGMGHVYGHWPILFNAGGTFQVPGDYLYRDYAPSGGRNGMFGILRVGEVPAPPEPANGGGAAGGGN